ncbi:MAG TPA: DUF2071 domain-containing protein [Chthoniobacterales bacterium]|nr:DUF2071 domain-containing protein [Chthoniobacterales bacterium]
MSLPGIHRFKRHPLPIVAHFRHSLVLTYALPREVLRPLLAPGLMLDAFGDLGFLAIALVQTERLRPAFLPAALGQDFFLSGYRIFTRFQTRSGRTLRGLRILRSDTNRAFMARFGNLLTHYHYRLATVGLSADADRLEVNISTPREEADLHVVADLREATTLPAGSPFSDWHQARLFAGPLPFTFDYEAETHSIVVIEGVRQNWHPRPVNVQAIRSSFLQRAPFAATSPVLASAFHVSNIPYRWKRGVVEPLPSPL